MESEIIHDKENDILYFRCPHCNMMCEVPVEEIRCTIFRHAIFKDGMKFVPPHASKAECDAWLINGEVWGCAKPFKFNGKKVEICDYI